jgi:DNA replication protein DnaC
MNSLTRQKKMTNPATDLPTQLGQLGLHATALNLDDFLARATKSRWSPQLMLEEMARAELHERSRRSVERRLRLARIGRFRPMADFDWHWPKKIDRPTIERALTLDFIPEARNFILLGSNGLGKTMIAQNIAYAAVQAGYTVLFRTASDILTDLHCDSPQILRRRLQRFARPDLLVIDELAYLSYDDDAADLLYELVSRRYERHSIVITTNKAFKEWNTVFPNATSIATLLDRLTHHADVTLLEGQSYRVRESEIEIAARRKKT